MRQPKLLRSYVPTIHFSLTPENAINLNVRDCNFTIYTMFIFSKPILYTFTKTTDKKFVFELLNFTINSFK